MGRDFLKDQSQVSRKTLSKWTWSWQIRCRGSRGFRRVYYLTVKSREQTWTWRSKSILWSRGSGHSKSCWISLFRMAGRCWPLYLSKLPLLRYYQWTQCLWNWWLRDTKELSRWQQSSCLDRKVISLSMSTTIQNSRHKKLWSRSTTRGSVYWSLSLSSTKISSSPRRTSRMSTKTFGNPRTSS